MRIRNGRQRAVIAGALALALALSACGDSDDGDTTEPDAGSETEPEEPDEDEDAPEEEGEDAPDEEEPEADDSPLEGELITFVVGVSPGGGFDAYARLMAPYLAEELGADVTVSNEPGAGSLLALNNTWAAEPDGTRIMLVNGFGVLGSILGGVEGIEFELDEFEYIGRIDRSLQMVSAHENYPVLDPNEWVGMSGPLVWAATGPGGGTANSGNLLCASLEIADCSVATGYSGSAEAILGVTAGEVDAIATDAASTIPTFNGNGQVPIFALTEDRHPELPDVPTILELGLEGENLAIAEAHVALLGAGRLLVAPPGTPDNIVQALRDAYENMVVDEEFLADAESIGRAINSLDGERSLELVQTSLNAPQAVRDVFAEVSE